MRPRTCRTSPRRRPWRPWPATWRRACPGSTSCWPRLTESVLAAGHGGTETDGGGEPRDVRVLPKAHLHLHFTGSLRHDTLLELADGHGLHLPDALLDEWPPKLRATDERGWFRFQRLYDIARAAIRTGSDVRRLLREAAEDERAEGSGWLEIQVDPTSYAP